MSEDPFDEVKADVAASLNSVEAGLQRWRGQRDASTSKRLLSELPEDMQRAVSSLEPLLPSDPLLRSSYGGGGDLSPIATRVSPSVSEA